jgi:hypothetical protein
MAAMAIRIPIFAQVLPNSVAILSPIPFFERVPTWLQIQRLVKEQLAY